MAGTFGSGTFGAGTFADTSAYAGTGAPTSITLALTPDQPVGTTDLTAAPDSITVDVTLDPPGGATLTNLDGSINTPITVALTLDEPALAYHEQSMMGLGAFGWGTMGTFEAGTNYGPVTVTGSHLLPVTVDPPAGEFVQRIWLDEVPLGLTLDTPAGAAQTAGTPDGGITIDVTVDTPTGERTDRATITDSIALPVTLDPPAGTAAAFPTVAPGSITIPVTLSAPTGSRVDAYVPPPGLVTFPATLPWQAAPPAVVEFPPDPGGATDVTIEAVDNPDGIGEQTATGTTGTGTALSWTFDLSFDPQPAATGNPAVIPADNPDQYTAATNTLPIGGWLTFPTTLPLHPYTATTPGTGSVDGNNQPGTKPPAGPWLGFPTAFPWPSGTAAIIPPDIVEAPEPDAPTTPPEEEDDFDVWGRAPIVDPIVIPKPRRAPVPATHFLGIGPWSSSVIWHGAPNYGVRKNSRQVVGPIVALPTATSKSFTLRLNGSSEATTEFDLPRSKAFIVEELTTDLWWRRRDPVTGELDSVGRFNADKVDITEKNDGVHVSVSWVDYRGLMADRLILDYAHYLVTMPDDSVVTWTNDGYNEIPTEISNPTVAHPVTKLRGKLVTTKAINVDSAWDKNTPVARPLAFILGQVGNMPVDISDHIMVADETIYGELSTPVELPLSTTIEDALTNLGAVCKKGDFEWWIDLPSDTAVTPKLYIDFAERGADKGIVLFDVSTGSGGIASWTRQGAADKYANNLFYSGSEGGVVVDIPAEIDQYQQRDANDGTSSLKGHIDLITAAGQKKLRELSDRRPTWTIVLQPGFWQGRGHIDIGDWISVHIRLGEDILTGKYRVTELNVDIDVSGVETVTLTLGRPAVSADPRSRYSALAKVVRKLTAYKNMETSV